MLAVKDSALYLQIHALGKHDIAHFALHAFLSREICVKEIVQRHGELDDMPGMSAGVGETEVKAKAAFQHVFVRTWHCATTANHCIVESSGLKLVVIAADEDAEARLDIIAAKAAMNQRVRIFVVDGLTLEISAGIHTN